MVVTRTKLDRAETGEGNQSMPVHQSLPGVNHLPVLASSPAPTMCDVTPARRQYHMLVKPVGAACNLDCTYCFYLHKAQMLGQPRQPRMTDEVLEQHVRQYIEGQGAGDILFSWQGGEPTLAGLEFFQRVVELQARYARPDQRIENDLQTNGTLLDEQWARFLKRHGFLVGLSCDGPQDLHDRFRVNKGGEPTFRKVQAAARLLMKFGVPFNALCVVNRENARRPLEVYRFLTRQLRTLRVQFIPCVEPRSFRESAPRRGGPVVGSPQARPGQPESIVTDWSVDPADWGEFLCAVWDEWRRRDYGRVFVNLFESAVAQFIGLPAQICTQAQYCGTAMVLEHDGDVYSCDHFVYPEYRLGNILRQHEADMPTSWVQTTFGCAKCDGLPRQCRECDHLNLCWGECPRNRLVRTPEGEPGLSYLCPGFRRFYSHIHEDLAVIARRVQGRSPQRRP